MAGSGAFCFFNELRLWGTPVTQTPTAVPTVTPSRTPTNVWYERMNSNPVKSALGWTSTEATTPEWRTYHRNCPGTPTYCWFFWDVAGSYQLSASTTQFASVQLTYSMSATGLFGNESCYIDYSVDTLFTNIATLDTTTPSITLPQTYNAWTGAAGISSLTIKIGSSEDCTCYFNELRLWGAPVTPQPTLPTTIPSKTPTAVPSDTSSGPTSPPTQSSNPPTLSPTAPTAQTSTPSKAPIYYTTIWFDDMSTNNAGWGSSSSEWTLFGESFEGCFTGTCCLTIGGSGSDEWVVRSTDISSYSSIRLQLDISTYLLYYDSSCRVYYSYTSKQRSTKIKIHESNPISNNDRYYYPDTIIDFPSSPSSDTIWIWLYSSSPTNPGNEYCVWDDAYLKGTPHTASTPQPSPNPTKRPTPHPINQPTPNPTKRPTPNPTLAQCVYISNFDDMNFNGEWESQG
eukprot:269058_1